MSENTVSENSEGYALEDGKALGTGAKPPQNGDVGLAALPAPEDGVSTDATIPGLQVADTVGANAPTDTVADPQPVAQQPVAQQPVAQQPVAQQPVAQQPVAQQPVEVTPQPVESPSLQPADTSGAIAPGDDSQKGDMQ